MSNRRAPLAAMMFLQYAVWGIWLPVLGQYLQASPGAGGLGFTGGQVGMILGLAGSVGAVSAPFIAGQLADRYFNTERFLGVLLIVGGVIKWITAGQTSYGAWLGLSVAYSVVYMPTLALTNSLAMAHLDNPERTFPGVRVWGTIGWIVAGWCFSIFWLQTNLQFQPFPPFVGGSETTDVTHRLADGLRFSGVLSLLYGVFAFTLPRTPPRRDGVEPLAFAKAFRLLRQRSFAVLVVASVLISVIHQIYFMKTGQFLVSLGLRESLIPQVMSIGQFAEIFVMAVLGVMLTRLGFRWVMLVGAMAYCIRYAIFAAVPQLGVVVVAQALHGLCYACFFAGAFIYVDRLADADIRHSAQTVFGIIILGLGPVLGGYLLGVLERAFTPPGGTLSYPALWYTVSAVALVAAASIAGFFSDETAAGAPKASPAGRRIGAAETQ